MQKPVESSESLVSVRRYELQGTVEVLDVYAEGPHLFLSLLVGPSFPRIAFPALPISPQWPN